MTDNDIQISHTENKDSYVCVIYPDLSRWPIVTRQRPNGTWIAVIRQAGGSTPIYKEVGVSREAIIIEAAAWLVSHQGRLCMEADLKEIETDAVGNMIMDNDTESLSAYMERDVLIERDKHGNFKNLLVEVDEDDDDGMEDEGDDEFV